MGQMLRPYQQEMLDSYRKEYDEPVVGAAKTAMVRFFYAHRSEMNKQLRRWMRKQTADRTAVIYARLEPWGA